MKSLSELCVSPCPWSRVDKHSVDVVSKDGHYIVDADRFWREDLANARLIAAAPELYEALSAFINWYEKNKPLPYEENGIQMITHYAKKAIAKASGEDEEKPLPCPFCGRPVLVGSDKFSPLFDVTCDICEYTSKAYRNRDEAIAAHNRVARAVMAAKDKEAK